MIDTERVIVLSMFKKLVNRLFGPDEEIKDEHYAYEYENEVDDVEKKVNQGRMPAFRFPVISDEEIYSSGNRELVEEKEREYSKSNPHIEELYDEYESTPLYENERWPGDRSSGNIFRAGSAPKYGVEPEIQRTSFLPESTKGENEPLLRKTATIKKRSNRPFSPSTVPSPVHGYSKPKKVEIVTNEDEELQLPYIDASVPVPEQIITEIFFQEKEEEESNLEAALEESFQQEVYLTKGIEHANTVHNVEEEALVEVDQIATTITNLPTSLEIEDNVEIGLPAKKKERIVPFNVLMLKSDKEKIAKAERIVPTLEVGQFASSLNVIVESGPEIQVQGVQHEREDSQQPDGVDEEPYYAFPSLDFLIPPETQIEDTEWLDSQSSKLEEALSHFAVQANVIEAVQGPTVTRFELTVGQGTKVSKVRNLTDDLKLALAAEDIRIQAPIPGRSSIGIEIPNRRTRPVRISEVIGTDKFQGSTSPLEAVLGLSLTGEPVTLDLRKMPHGMIAGATGSGKSVCINSILISLLYKASPSDLKMMLIDPKMVELAPFNGIPHLISPVITDVKAATAALKWAVAEMERRYELLAHAGVRDIERYNKAVMESRRFSLKMPYLLIVIDELADLMMMAPADVEVSISRIAQKARACGIHLIIATQRPSVDVITGTIKANVPTRIAFSVSSQIDSRTIIDSPGAERLLGKGDMLYIGNGQSSSVRLQGTFVTDDEIERIIEHVQSEASPNYLFGQDDLLASAVEEEEIDPLFEEVCLFIHEQGSASTSLLQRNFSIGYNRAAKLIDRMEKNGFISGQKGSKARDVFLTESDLERLSERIE